MGYGTLYIIYLKFVSFEVLFRLEICQLPNANACKSLCAENILFFRMKTSLQFFFHNITNYTTYSASYFNKQTLNTFLM